MKFLSGIFSANSIFSSMMGISTFAPNVNNLTLNAIQSPNNFFETLLKYYLYYWGNILVYMYELIVKILYAIVKWILVMIDFFFLLIRQMIGLNTNTGSIEDLTQSDMIFKFVFNERVLDVIKAMIGFAIILLLLFCIFAIVKSEYDYAVNGGDNNKTRIFVRVLKSLMLMVLVPVISIGGLLLSNAILKSLYIATAGGVDTSLSTQIFIASTYDANAYRRYADRGYKIPITYNFEEVSEQDNVTGWGSDGDIEELDAALKAFNSSSVWNRGLTTFTMFYTYSFLDMDSVDRLNDIYKDLGKVSSYHNAYDENIYTNKNQYYIMADVIEYSLKTRAKLYIKSAEDLYKSYTNLYYDSSVPDEVKNQMEKYMPIVYDNTQGTYTFTAHYRDYKDAHVFTHKRGAKSESEGAQFLMSVEKNIEYNDKVYTYYYPLLSTDENFATNYYEKIKQPVVAKGLFEKGEFPTGIREQDGEIMFYKDDLNVPTIVDFFPTISYEKPPEGTTTNVVVELIKGGVSAVTGVDVSQFIPYIYYSFDIFSLFQKKTYNIMEISDGYLQLDYNFSQSGYTIENVYKLGDINFNLLVLMFSSIIIIGIMLKMIFGIGIRVLDVLLLAITYPAVLSTYPLDSGERFKTWYSTLIKKILGIYGVVIGVNLVLLLFPVISELRIITPEMIENSIGAGWLPASFSAGFLNYVVILLFELAAFTLLKSATGLIESIVNSTKSDKSSEAGILKDGETVVNELKKVPETIGNIVSGKIFMDIGEEVIDTAISFIPGSAVVKTAIERAQERSHIKNMKANPMEMLSGGGDGGSKANKEEVETSNNENQETNDATPNSESAGGGENAGGGVGGAEAAGAAAGAMAAGEVAGGEESENAGSSDGSGSSMGEANGVGDSSVNIGGGSGDASINTGGGEVSASNSLDYADVGGADASEAAEVGGAGQPEEQASNDKDSDSDDSEVGGGEGEKSDGSGGKEDRASDAETEIIADEIPAFKLLPKPIRKKVIKGIQEEDAKMMREMGELPSNASEQEQREYYRKNKDSLMGPFSNEKEFIRYQRDTELGARLMNGDLSALKEGFKNAISDTKEDIIDAKDAVADKLGGAIEKVESVIPVAGELSDIQKNEQLLHESQKELDSAKIENNNNNLMNAANKKPMPQAFNTNVKVEEEEDPLELKSEKAKKILAKHEDKLNEIMDQVSGGDIMGALKNAVKLAGPLLKAGWHEGKARFKAFKGKASQKFKEMKLGAKNKINNAKQGEKDTVSGAKAKVKDTLTNDKNKVKNALPGKKKKVEGDISDKDKKSVKDKDVNTENTLNDTPNNVESDVSPTNSKPEAQKVESKETQKEEQKVKDNPSEEKTAKQKTDAVKKETKEQKEKVNKALKKEPNKASKGSGEKAKTTNNPMAKIGETIKSKANDVENGFNKIKKAANPKAVIEKAGKNFKSLKAKAGKGLGKVKSGLKFASASMSAAKSALPKLLKGDIEGAAESAYNTYTKKGIDIEKVAENVASKAEGVVNKASNVVEGVKSKVGTAKNKVKSTASNVKKKVTGKKSSKK